MATDYILKWLQIAAILVAGAWAYYQFFLSGSSDWMVNLDLATEIIPYSRDTRLLVVHVKSKNPRNAVLDVERSNGSFKLTVRQVPDGLKANSTIATEDGKVLAVQDLMPDGGYEFLPNAEFDNVVAVVLPAGAMVALEARLTRGDDEVITDRIVRVQ